MQKEIHPDLKETTITCACGEVYHTKSTEEDIRVEVCSNCHPFYTGKQRQAAKGGRVERFNKKYGMSDEPEFEVDEAEAAEVSADFRAEEAEKTGDAEEEAEEVEETEEEKEKEEQE